MQKQVKVDHSLHVNLDGLKASELSSILVRIRGILVCNDGNNDFYSFTKDIIKDIIYILYKYEKDYIELDKPDYYSTYDGTFKKLEVLYKHSQDDYMMSMIFQHLKNLIMKYYKKQKKDFINVSEELFDTVKFNKEQNDFFIGRKESIERSVLYRENNEEYKRQYREKRDKEYSDYINGKQWKDVRKIVFEKCGGRCVVCNKDEKLDCHHRSYSKFKREGEHEDCFLLCKVCHKLFHDYKRTDMYQN